MPVCVRPSSMTTGPGDAVTEIRSGCTLPPQVRGAEVMGRRDSIVPDDEAVFTNLSQAHHPKLDVPNARTRAFRWWLYCRRPPDQPGWPRPDVAPLTMGLAGYW